MTSTDITDILYAGGIRIDHGVFVRETSFTYPLKKNVWDNWLPFAFIAFGKLGKEVKTFATIGTGCGADAIGAHYAFPKLEVVVVTDIDERVVPVAAENVKRYEKNCIGLTGSLCEPLRKHGITVDVIYENLPNIPDAEAIVNGYKRSSRYRAGSFEVHDHVIKAFLLESHFATLIEAKESLNDGGSVICSVGGRVPYVLLRRMVESAGYEFRDLVSGLKVQTEPEEVLSGYAEAEKGDVTFDFYKMDEATKSLEHQGLKKPFIELPGHQLKELLVSFRISAKEALKLYRQDPSYNIGHVVHMIGASVK